MKEIRISPPCFEPNCEFCVYFQFCKNKNMTKDFKKSTGGRPRLNENVIEEKILQFLKNNGKSDSKTIIKQLNHSRNNIERILNKMQEKGLIIVVNDIKYTTKGRNGRVWDIRNTESFINLTVK